MKHGTVTASHSFAWPVPKAWQAWTDPAARRIWEASGGMAYTSFDVREGGSDLMEIRGEGGAAIGDVVQTYAVLVPERLLVAHIRIRIGGAVAMTSQVTARFTAEGAATRIDGTEQVCWIEGGDPAQHEAGWRGLFDRFGTYLEASVDPD